MSDHVTVQLHYSFVTGPSIEVRHAAPTTVSYLGLDIQVRDADITIGCDGVHDLQEARGLAELALRSWEAEVGLQHGPGALTFEFVEGHVVRSPQAGVVPVLQPSNVTHHHSIESPIVTQILRYFPVPSGGFRLTPEAELAWLRYRRCVSNAEPLQAAAYHCLTLVEAAAGAQRNRRRAAAAHFNIQFKVLDTLGLLAGPDRGDPADVRKVDGATKAEDLIPLLDSERGWLLAAMRQLIWKLGAIDPTSRPLRMSDLPSLRSP